MRGFHHHQAAAFIRRSTVALAIGGAGAALLPAAAQAQLLNQLENAVGAGQAGGAAQGMGAAQGGGALGGLGAALPSVDKASPTNLAGLIQYCIQNNYLGGGAASVKDSLLGKAPGAASDSQFKAGSNGLLQTGQGQNFGLGGGGLKAQITQKVCDLVLQHAKSLL